MVQFKDLAITKTSANDDDYLVLQSADNGQTYKITKADFLAGLSSVGGDSNASNVVLLMHFNGANNSTTFTDVKGLSNTVIGTPKITTSDSIFGGASLNLDGSSGLYFNHPNLVLGSNDFTVEFFAKRTGGTDTNLLVYGEAGADGIGIAWVNNNIRIRANSVTINDLITSQSLSNNTWYHFALCRSGNVFRFFINGTNIYTATYSINLLGSLMILGSYTTTGAYFFTGVIDELRITRSARYASNFVTPAQEYSL